MTVLTLVLIMGSAMYVIEGADNGFTSIPRGVYWAIVTVTTVGYGDIAPATEAGQVIAAAAMIIGYSLIIIPTGIFASELVRVSRKEVTTQSCPSCIREGHDTDAVYCKYCGAKL
jgi:voltage-gated potassium channel